MAKSKSVPKIALSASRDIPFNKLVLSQSNVRRIKAGVSVEELAEDIARRTLLQSLTVRAVVDESGAETGVYEIPAGGRRYRALELLVKQKRLAPTAPIPCVIRTDGLAEEDSLAENIQRAPLHPLDQFRAFQTMREKGMSEEEIAAAFFATPAVVKQRLKLVAVNPRLLELYAEDQLTLEQLMAFTVSPDQQKQSDVWEAISRGYSREPYQIRRMLTEGAVRIGDKRAIFVRIEAYEAAGGAVLRDLFSASDEGWLEDAALLNRLVSEKLDIAADALRAEGWKWIETAVDFPYGHTFGLRRLDGEPAALTDAEQQAYDAAKSEYERLHEEHDGAEELSDEVDRRLGELEAEIETFESRPCRFAPEEIARAGVFINLDPSGQLRIERGFVRREDEPEVDAEESDQETERSAESGVDDEVPAEPGVRTEDDDDDRPVSDRLVGDLTAVRTIALRHALGAVPDLAFVAVLHVMALSLFYHFRGDSCLGLDCRQRVPGGAGAPGIADFAPAAALAARHADWEARLPENSEDLWATLLSFNTEDRSNLFAHCAGMIVDASIEPHNRRPRAIAHADRVAAALELDLRREGWRPTPENYLLRITKGQILEAVREARGEADALRIANLKKADMALAAEELLRQGEWLPQVLRTPALSKVGDGGEPLADVSPAYDGEGLAVPAIAAE